MTLWCWLDHPAKRAVRTPSFFDHGGQAGSIMLLNTATSCRIPAKYGRVQAYGLEPFTVLWLCQHRVLNYHKVTPDIYTTRRIAYGITLLEVGEGWEPCHRTERVFFWWVCSVDVFVTFDMEGRNCYRCWNFLKNVSVVYNPNQKYIELTSALITISQLSSRSQSRSRKVSCKSTSLALAMKWLGNFPPRNPTSKMPQVSSLCGSRFRVSHPICAYGPKGTIL